MENHTRERLTGAAILVALIVLVVPELLSGPRRPAPQPVAAVDEPPIRSYTLPLGEAQQSSPPQPGEGMAGSALPAASGTVSAGVAHRSAGPPGSAGPSGGAGPSGDAVSGGAPGPATAPRPATAAEPHDHEPHDRDTGAHDARGWTVQVGSFGSRSNADRLARELKLKGYGAFVSESKSRGRRWYRVRVGPERERSAAAAVAARLRASGLKGALVRPR